MNVAVTSSHLKELHCSHCGSTYAPFIRQTLSNCCQAPLLCQYVLEPGSIPKTSLLSGPRSLWRYEALLPVIQPENRVSLGEGFTPILSLNRLAGYNSLRQLSLKDEGLNPTGSF